jgi:hypothetical protein
MEGATTMRFGRGAVAIGVLTAVLASIPGTAGAESYAFEGTLGGSEKPRAVHAFTVDVPSVLTIALRLSDASVRVVYALRDPSGAVVSSGEASALVDQPLVQRASSPGTWRISLRARRAPAWYRLTIDVAPENRPPQASDDAANALAGERVLIPVLDNDRDPEGGALTVTSVGSASHGTATVKDGANVAYVSAPDFEGEDSFSYEVCDGGTPVLCASATVRVQVSLPPASEPTAVPSPSPSPSGSTSTTSRTSSTLMPLVKGLSTRWSYSRDLGAYIQRVSWAELQPTPFGPIVHPNPIDQAIARGVPFRVRLLAGWYAPDWVKALGTVTITDTFLGANDTYVVPRWWTQAYADAYVDLIAKLAAEYDGKVPAFSMSGPMTIAAEPFLHQLTSADTRAAVLVAGWSTAKERRAFERMIDAHTAFSKTRTFMAINPGQTYDPVTGRWNLGDLSYMRALTDHFVQVLGPRAIVQNNSLNVTRATKNEKYMAMYEYMKQLRASGVPIAFQTAQTALVEDLPWVLDYAVAAGAHLVELPAKWQELDTPEHLALVDQLLRANEP